MLYFSVSMSENNYYGMSERIADSFEIAHLFYSIIYKLIFPHVKTFSWKDACSVGDAFHSIFWWWLYCRRNSSLNGALPLIEEDEYIYGALLRILIKFIDFDSVSAYFILRSDLFCFSLSGKLSVEKSSDSLVCDIIVIFRLITKWACYIWNQTSLSYFENCFTCGRLI